ncbi:MAG: sel1 repeat family protein [Rhodospirillales bacterium]|nr:sel1 repeat family protein [Rhodospirillales bacterium]
MSVLERILRLILATFFTMSLPGAPASAAPVAPPEQIQLIHKGVLLIATAPPAGAKFSISLVAPKPGMEKMRDALNLLYEKSELSRTTIEKLKKNGQVFIVYDPKFPNKVEDLTRIKAAMFFPNYFKNRGDKKIEKSFLTIVTRFGIKWTTPELAGVLAHELVGHAVQQLLGRIDILRELDLECEAWLYQEQVLQDLGVDKFHRDIVNFRQNLENHYCSDFKRHLRQKDPPSLKLWDVLNPDVPWLLAAFEIYVQALKASGISGKAIKAATGMRIEDRYRQVLKEGLPEDQFALGLAFRDGLGIPRDPKKAAKLFELAAGKGIKQAQLEIAFAYDKGLGVTPSPGKATKWYYQAAAQGDPFAQFKLARRLVAGTGVRKDEAASVKWFRRSAKQGMALAQYHLGRSYAKGRGVGKNLVNAFKLQIEAAKKGLALAQYRLGKIYANGEGVAKDAAKAADWFRKAAVQGDKRSQFSLARILRKGLGLPKNEAEALIWYKKAAEAGHGKAQLSLGFIYEKGQGTTKDIVQAYKWYALAAKKGVKGTAERRDKIAKGLTPDQLAQVKKIIEAWKPNKG